MFIINKIIDVLIAIVALFLLLVIGGFITTVACVLLYLGLIGTCFSAVYVAFIKEKSSTILWI